MDSTTFQYGYRHFKQSSQNQYFFSAINFNIKSLSVNFDELNVLRLTDLKYSFSLIRLSETKIKKDVGKIANTSIPCYDFISKPTLNHAGGVDFYVKKGLQYMMAHMGHDIKKITNLKKNPKTFFEIVPKKVTNLQKKNVIQK